MVYSMKILIFLILVLGNILAYGNQLVIGVLKFEPPYTSIASDGKHFYGFCIDLMDVICKRLHESCEYKVTAFDEQVEDLLNKRIDLTFLPSPITSTENIDYLYSLPYLPSTGQFMTLSNNNIHSLKELKDKKIGVIQASYLKPNFLSHYTSQSNIHEYANTTLLIHALNNHKIDAILINSSVAKYLANNIGNLSPVGEPIQFGMGYGISALKKNADLINKINQILLQLSTDGTYEKIYIKYFGN